MKKAFPLLLCVATLALTVNSCRREPDTLTATTPSRIFLKNFYDRNKPQPESFTFQAAAGATFTTQKGTVVTVPPNAFVDANNQYYTGTTTVYITDIYQKSDMLYADKHTVTVQGQLLESGGEFNIKAVNSIQAPLQLASNASIQIEQPVQPGEQFEQGMMAFIWGEGPVGGDQAWLIDCTGVVGPAANQAGYIFSLYQFSSPISAGTWCNSDQPAFGNAPVTTLTLEGTDDANIFATDVFLLFPNNNSMIHLYRGLGNQFTYSYAPQGEPCTLVAVGAKEDELYATFMPVTIGTQSTTVNFTLSATTENAFREALEALN